MLLFGLIYIFKNRFKKISDYILKKNKDQKRISKIRRFSIKVVKNVSAWWSSIQVIFTNSFFIFMPENINYLVTLIKNMHNFKNVGFLIYSIILLIIFAKIFTDFLIFYIDLLVKILINKNRKKEIEKENQLQIHDVDLDDLEKEEELDDKLQIPSKSQKKVNPFFKNMSTLHGTMNLAQFAINNSEITNHNEDKNLLNKSQKNYEDDYKGQIIAMKGILLSTNQKIDIKGIWYFLFQIKVAIIMMTFLYFKKYDYYIIPITVYFINLIFFAFVINIDEEYKEDWFIFIICKEILSICKY